MKQNINLYKTEKKGLVAQFTSREMIWILSGFLTILFLITTVNLYKHFVIKKQLNILDKEKLEQSQKLQEMAGQIPEEQTRNQLIAEIKKMTTEKKDKEEILDLLLTAQVRKINGYAGFFDALARGTVSGLWLTEFGFKEGGDYVYLKGESLKAEYVPKMIEKLSAEPVFQGKTFELFDLALNEKTKRFDFVLQTESGGKSP